MKSLFIINPISGKGRGAKPARLIARIDKLFQSLGWEYRVRIWDRPDRIGELIQEAIDEQFEAVIAVGGDGTINEIGRRLVNTGIAMGVIPMGSGNGFARHLGYSRRPYRAVEQLRHARIVSVDTGEFGGIHFMNAAGIGIDAEVAKRFSRSKTRGLKTYLRIGIRTFLGYKAFNCTLRVDDDRSYDLENILLIDIANGTEWGNGAKIAPNALLSDGWMEAVILQRTSVRRVPRLLQLLFQGKVYQHPNVTIIRGKKFLIQRSRAGNAHVDGEAVKLGRSITCEIREKSVRLLVPERKRATV